MELILLLIVIDNYCLGMSALQTNERVESDSVRER
jgi:hypothetical protein